MASALELLLLAQSASAQKISLTTGSVSNTTAETIIGSFIVPSGYIKAAGQGLSWYTAGTFSVTGTPTLTTRMRLGSVTGPILASASNPVTFTPGGFAISGFMFFLTVGSGGSATTYGNAANDMAGAGGAQSPYIEPAAAFNTATATGIYVTAQFSAASASNIAATTGGSLFPI